MVENTEPAKDIKLNNNLLEQSSHSPVGVYQKFPINSFVWKKQRYSICPPLPFKCRLNEKAGLWEILGESSYEDLLAYGEKLSGALQILEEEILPILWEDSLKGDKVRLSERAEKMTVDLKNRVNGSTSEDKEG